MPAPGKGVGFWVRGFEPLDDPAWAWIGPGGKRAFWKAVARSARSVFEDERRRGIDRTGRPLIPLAEKTRAHRRSAMGHADPNAPVLIPAHDASRTIRFLMTDVTESGVWCRWKHDPRVKTSWGTILRYHAEGRTAGGKVRDVVGISPAGMAEVRREAAGWWQANRGRLVVRGSGGRVVATAQGVMVTAPPGPAAVAPEAARPDRMSDWLARFDAARARPSSRVASSQSAHRDFLVGSDRPFTPQSPVDFRTPWGRFSSRAAAEPPAGPARLAPPVRFGPSKARVEADDAALEAIRAILGPSARPRDVASLVGAPDSAEVTVRARAGRLDVGLDDPEERYLAFRTIERDDAGDLVIHNDAIMVFPEHQGEGIGRAILGRQVEQAARLGARKILARAERSPRHVGYHVWPRLGFDAPIPEKLREQLPAELAGARRLSDLMATPAGRDWWREHGTTVDVTFDLAPGSRSRRLLAAYLARSRRRDETKSLFAGDRDTEPGRAEEPDLAPGDDALLDAICDRVPRRRRRRRRRKAS